METAPYDPDCRALVREKRHPYKHNPGRGGFLSRIAADCPPAAVQSGQPYKEKVRRCRTTHGIHLPWVFLLRTIVSENDQREGVASEEPTTTEDRKNLKQADLVGANLERASLMEANLTRALLDHAHMDHARLRAACLTSADMDFANLRCARMRGAKLHDVDLTTADLRDANLRSADFRWTRLYMARLPHGWREALEKANLIPKWDLASKDYV